MNPKNLLNVTDLSSYLYCPRKFYLKKVKGFREPPNKAMIEGRIRHDVLEIFLNEEQGYVEAFKELTQKEIIFQFQSLIEDIINHVFYKNRGLIDQFQISKPTLKVKIQIALQKEVSLRAGAIAKAMQEGFLGKDLWQNLTPKYISEMPLISEKLGLKGRADRVVISEDTIIPFELKTRETEKIWPSDEIQLTAYAMLLEEKYQKSIPIGILEAGNIKHEIIITPALKQQVRDLVEEIRLITKKPNLKFPSNFSKCQSCSLEKECDEL